MIRIFIIIIFYFLITNNISFALPKEIIIIRHGDKLKQSNPGINLSAKGYVRAINFAFYFLNKFGHADFIFASDPINVNHIKHLKINVQSLRELQTVSALANILTIYAQQEIPIYHPYTDNEYEKLAKDILTGSKYNNKVILICWSHEFIPNFAVKLGVKSFIPNWPEDDFDSVFFLQYDEKKLINFTILPNQYPTNDITWEQLFSKVNHND